MRLVDYLAARGIRDIVRVKQNKKALVVTLPEGTKVFFNLRLTGTRLTV